MMALTQLAVTPWLQIRPTSRNRLWAAPCPSKLMAAFASILQQDLSTGAPTAWGESLKCSYVDV